MLAVVVGVVAVVIGGVSVVPLAVPKNPSGSLEDETKGWPDQRDCWDTRCAVEYRLFMQIGNGVKSD